MRIVERIFQVTVFVVAVFMVLGGGFFWREFLGNNFSRSETYTLYKSLPGLVLPCDFKPPFIGWLQGGHY
jgi:hypothetical protein